jgi:hypothetical protein
MTSAGKKSAEPTTPCPWCSEAVPVSATECPACGASLRNAADGEVLGVTQVDPAAVSRASRIKPGRLATWLGAENTSDKPELAAARAEPPSEAARREMLRLELAAIDAEIEAKMKLAAAERDLPPEDAAEPKPG